MTRVRILLTAAATAALAATSAHGQAVTVLGGGMARLCSYAALAGDSDATAESNCTMALGEAMSPLDRAGTFVNRGVMKLRRKEFAAARADFDSALQIKADLGEAYLNRGAAFLGVRRFADGLTDLNRALELGVQQPEKAFYNRGLAHERLGQRDAAYQDYTRALTLRPDWDQPRAELARLSLQTP